MSTATVLDQPSTESRSLGRLLIAEDDLAVRMPARLALEEAGYCVTEAGDGYTALTWLASQQFDAIVLDAHTPRMNGFETCRKMRAYLGQDPVPIIVTTGPDDQSIELALDCGATDVVAKPVNWRVITKRLESLIAGRNATAKLQVFNGQIASLLQSSPEALLALDRECVITRVYQIDRLPRAFRDQLSIGACLFDAVPPAFRVRMMRAWDASLTGNVVEKFMFELGLDGDPIAIDGRLLPGKNEETLCLLQDQSDAIRTERHLHNLTYKDSVTGIANERHFTEQIAGCLKLLKNTDLQSVLIRCATRDMFNLEARVGRSGIDKLARAIVSRIESVLETFKRACRGTHSPLTSIMGLISYADFGIFLSGFCEQQRIDELSRLLSEKLGQGYEIDGTYCTLSWSIAVVDTTDCTPTADAMLTASSLAMASGFELAGLHNVRRYTSLLRADVCERLELEGLLRRDIADGKLEIHYQPKFDLKDLNLVGIEALIRWNSAEKGLVSPARFIPLAEKAGLTLPLTHLIIQKLFDQMVFWRNSGHNCVPVSINLSGINPNSRNFVEEVRTGIEQRNIDPAMVALEITESIMFEGTNKTMRNIAYLRALGVRVSVNDFGTSYVTLDYLRKLPVDCLKIDRSFVENITSDATAKSIARAILDVGHDVDLHVVAEGVETEDQLRCLQALHRNSVQVFFTGRAVRGEDLVTVFWGCGGQPHTVTNSAIMNDCAPNLTYENGDSRESTECRRSSTE